MKLCCEVLSRMPRSGPPWQVKIGFQRVAGLAMRGCVAVARCCAWCDDPCCPNASSSRVAYIKMGGFIKHNRQRVGVLPKYRAPSSLACILCWPNDEGLQERPENIAERYLAPVLMALWVTEPVSPPCLACHSPRGDTGPAWTKVGVTTLQDTWSLSWKLHSEPHVWRTRSLHCLLLVSV